MRWKCPVCQTILAKIEAERPWLPSAGSQVATYRCEKGHVFLTSRSLPHRMLHHSRSTQRTIVSPFTVLWSADRAATRNRGLLALLVLRAVINSYGWISHIVNIGELGTGCDWRCCG